ncbi:MAG: DUF4129 domain-containing protein [Candidatus Acidiferrales bacterium]
MALSATAAPRSQTSSSPPTSPDIDLKTYEAQLDSYATQISKARRQPAALARIGVSLPDEWVVRTGQADPDSVTVSTDWLNIALADLSAHPKDADNRVREIDARLSAMREAAVQLGAAQPSASDSRTRLDAIFHGPEFKNLHGPTEIQILGQRIARWLVEQIMQLLMHFHLRANVGNVLSWIVIGIAFAFLCWWLWHRFSHLAPKVDSTQASPAAPRVSSREWLDEALAAADRGEYREAVHCAYWAAIARLEDSGRLSRDRARTPREALRQLRSANPGERETLRVLTRNFELVWYGYRPVSDADWIGARTQLENMGCLRRSTAATVNS